MLHKYQELKAMNTLHWFISAETSRIQEKNKDKSIHRYIYSPSEIIYTVSLQKPYLRLSLTRHISYSTSDLECRTQDPQTRSIWPQQSAWLTQAELLLWVILLTRTWQAGWEQRAQKALWTQVHTLHKRRCLCTKPNAGLSATHVCYSAGSSNSSKGMWFMIATQPPGKPPQHTQKNYLYTSRSSLSYLNLNFSKLTMYSWWRTPELRWCNYILFLQ